MVNSLGPDLHIFDANFRIILPEDQMSESSGRAATP
jgi:hypothetical protein